MPTPAGGEIGGEVHEGHDQMLDFVACKDVAKVGEAESDIADGDDSIAPSGTFHDCRNTGSGSARAQAAKARTKWPGPCSMKGVGSGS